jgi:hypothetical protein
MLFLDEPTTGFDPSARRKSWDLIEALIADGTTVLLTTHYLDEAEHLADRVGVLMQGRMVAEGPPADHCCPSADRLGYRAVGRIGRVECAAGVARRRVPRTHRRARRGERVVSGFPSNAALVVRQTRYQLKFFTRVPIALFFTLFLPIVMLILFNALFGDDFVCGDDACTPGNRWPVSQFYTGGLAAYTAVSATFTNLANMVPLRRDEGVLKRWRGTPLPTWTYVTGFVLSAVVIAMVGVLIMLTMGVVLYDLSIDWAKMPAAVVTFTVGVASFAALGMALASLVKSASSCGKCGDFAACVHL